MIPPSDERAVATSAAEQSAPSSHPATKRLRNPINGNFYQRIDVSMPWHEAKRYCERLGGHLATVTSAAENQFIYENFGRDQVCWLGATDEVSEGQWRWVTGEPFEYRNWFGVEPNNLGKGEDYLVMGDTRSVVKESISYYYRFGAKWNDHAAHGRYRGKGIAFSVCEWESAAFVSAREHRWKCGRLRDGRFSGARPRWRGRRPFASTWARGACVPYYKSLTRPGTANCPHGAILSSDQVTQRIVLPQI